MKRLDYSHRFKMRDGKLVPRHECIDIDLLIQERREEELARLKAMGKAWTRGEPIDNLCPSLREFIEKYNVEIGNIQKPPTIHDEIPI